MDMIFILTHNKDEFDIVQYMHLSLIKIQTISALPCLSFQNV